MLSKQEKLEAIYEAMADKTLSEGCMINTYSFTKRIVAGVGDGGEVYTYCQSILGSTWSLAQITRIHACKIIGHPVRIGDVLEYWDFEGTEYALLEKWENKRLPIDEQSDECIDFVYSLIGK